MTRRGAGGAAGKKPRRRFSERLLKLEMAERSKCGGMEQQSALYTFVADIVEGIYKLMHSYMEGPTNIGCPLYISADELVHTVVKVSEKKIHIGHVGVPVGV